MKPLLSSLLSAVSGAAAVATPLLLYNTTQRFSRYVNRVKKYLFVCSSANFPPISFLLHLGIRIGPGNFTLH